MTERRDPRDSDRSGSGAGGREHLLLTVLGTNPQEALYGLGGQECRARMAPLALLRLLPGERRPSHVLALCTAQARELSWPILDENLPEGCTAEVVNIPDSDAPEDVNAYLAAIAGAVGGRERPRPEQPVRLTMDVTHGFRHFSFLTYVGVLYLAALRRVSIAGSYYGLFRPDRREREANPFLDLGPLLELPRWVHALKVLEETGSTAPMAEAIRPDASRPGGGNQAARNISRALTRFSEAYLSGLPLELGAEATLILEDHLKPLRKRLSKVHRLPLTDELVGDLAGAMHRYALGESTAPRGDGWKGRIGLDDDELKRQAAVVDSLLGHNHIAVALRLMSEWTVSWMALRLDRGDGWLDYSGARREAQNLLNAMAAAAQDGQLRELLGEEQRKLGGFWSELRDLRNGYAHHGMRSMPLGSGDRQHEIKLSKVRDHWETLRSCPDLPASTGARGARLLVSPMGLRPGVVFSAVHACRLPLGFGESPTECLVICSQETRDLIDEALQMAEYEGDLQVLQLEDPFGGQAEIKRLVRRARESLFGAKEVLVNVTGGTTLMGLVAEALANEARSLAFPVRRFGLIDRRPGDRQKTDPYQTGEVFWLDGERALAAGGIG